MSVDLALFESVAMRAHQFVGRVWSASRWAKASPVLILVSSQPMDSGMILCQARRGRR